MGRDAAKKVAQTSSLLLHPPKPSELTLLTIKGRWRRRERGAK